MEGPEDQGMRRLEQQVQTHQGDWDDVDPDQQQLRLKVAIVGPAKAGKSRIANLLANLSSPPEGKYDPTVGVRIVTTTRRVRAISHKDSSASADVTVPVEIWDCSGSSGEQDALFPAVLHGLNACIFVFDASSERQLHELPAWGEFVMGATKMHNTQAGVWAHEINGPPNRPIGKALKIPLSSGTISIPVRPVTSAVSDDTPPAPTDCAAALDHLIARAYSFHPQSVFNTR